MSAHAIYFTGLAVVLSVSFRAVADEPVDEASEPSSQAVVSDDEDSDRPSTLRLLALDAPALTRDLRQRRTALEERGVRVNVFLNDQYQAVLTGGADGSGGGRNAASVDTLITFDLGKLGVVPNAEVLLHLQSNWGAGVNARTGGLFQVNDDADGSIGGHVAQLWYRQHFPEHRASLTLGYLDYQTIVDRNAYANSEDKQFMHQSLDNNPLIPLRIGMGVSLMLKPTSWYSLILGIADGQSVPYKGGISGAFHEEDWYTAYLENGFQVELPSNAGDLPGNYRLGFFYDPGPRKIFRRNETERRTRAGDYGVYVSLDQMLVRESEDDDQGLGVFARFGYRSPETNRMSRFWSAGFSYKGLFPTRDVDVLGFGFSLLRSSHLYRERVDDRFKNETVYEAYYAIHVSDQLVVTPDIQYIDNPGADGAISHAIVAGVRLRMSF